MSGVSGVPGCSEVCAEPCCITTTTTTGTFTSTATSVTATVTSTTVTTSVTGTTTSVTSVTTTVTSVTGTNTTTSQTNTHTTTFTSTDTVTQTATSYTATMTTMQTTAATTTPMTTEAPTTTEVRTTPFPWDPSSAVRLTVQATVSVEDSLNYVTDSRVSAAYKEVMLGITGLYEDMVDIQMIVDEPGNITVTYILNIPNDNSSISLQSVKDKLDAVTVREFNVLLTQKMEEVGAGQYTQQVLAVESENPDNSAVSSAAPQPLSVLIYAAPA
ncbi:unnamed protein product [Effrenium voratum]|uniref:SEA domain-containing protein n=1 Tax=Effrenium voratum TaxID=2562239 RepID=A0AA36HS26_9DINO|nr:unnamed protein product [Effrenium voratum]